jgi:hypothetical protein
MRRPRPSAAAGLIACAVLLGFTCYTTFLAPRPYYVTDIDSEQDYYYNARLAAHGLPLSVHHPGTPIHLLGRVILAGVGEELEHTQRFHDVAYLAAALATALAIVLFVRLAARDESFGVTLLALSCVLAWPTTLTYLNNFGADSFIVAAGLPTLACFWLSLTRPLARARIPLLWTGVGLGVCLAVKMTFAPLVAAVGAATLVRSWTGTSGGRGRFHGILPLAAGLAAGYLTAMLPIWGRLTLVWWRLFQRPDVVPQGGGFLADMVTSLGVMGAANPLLLGVTAAALVLAAVLAGRAVAAGGASRAEFDFVAGGVLLAVLALGFGYTAAASATIMPDAEPGVRLRNMSPAVLIIPFAILYGARWFRSRIPTAVQLGLAAVAIGMVGVGIGRHVAARTKFIEARQRRIESTRARIDQFVEGDRRVAFWTAWDQDYLGPASFHFWGNYRYANHAFDRVLAEHFPKYAFVRLRNIERQADPPPASTSKSRYGWLGDAYWGFQGWLLRDRPSYRELDEMISGQSERLPIGAIALPTRELAEIPSLGATGLTTLAKDQFGEPRVWTEQVAGIEWLFLDLPSGEPAPSDNP